MKLILCLDDNNGMSFHNRRQSRDLVVIQKIAALTEGDPVWMNAYSAKLFDGVAVDCMVDDQWMQRGSVNGFCFAENVDIRDCIPYISAVYVFRWNRVYPAQLYCPQELLDRFVLTSTQEFTGKSHPVITLEVYGK